MLCFQFPQIGVVQKTPESITTATLKEIHCPYLSQQVERKLPPIYKIREKVKTNMGPNTGSQGSSKDLAFWSDNELICPFVIPRFPVMDPSALPLELPPGPDNELGFPIGTFSHYQPWSASLVSS